MKMVQAKHYSRGRLRAIRVVVVHTMESPETDSTAEGVAEYFRTVKRPASAHVNVDNNSEVRSVNDEDTAYAAPGCNADGLQLEHAGFASQGPRGWNDTYSQQMLRRSAAIVADWCRKYNIPPRHLTNEELARGSKGIIGHVQASQVYRRSTHTDPGPDFPWKQYIELVQQALKSGTEDDMTPQELLEYQGLELTDADANALGSDYKAGQKMSVSWALRQCATLWGRIRKLEASNDAARADITARLDRIEALLTPKKEG